jgi:hypothetical protein
MDTTLKHNAISSGQVDNRSENRIPLSPLTQGIKLNFRLFNRYKFFWKFNHRLIDILYMKQVVY